MAAGGGGGSVSARELARSVAHRLKYYIDVQRKEISFDSSGLIRDEMERSSCYTHPACLLEWRHGWPLEHDFAEIKLEASLRTYMGNTKECYQKVQESPEKQKDLEKFIKKMARDYVPDQTNESRAKTQRKSYWLRTPSSLHRTATPSMSAEEVRRLISSASKLIVAATSEISPKALGRTQEVVSTPKQTATRATPSLTCAWKQSLSSTHKDEAGRASHCPSKSLRARLDQIMLGCMQGCHEEFKTKLNRKASEKNDGKKLKFTKKRKNMKYREKPTELSSNISHKSYKTKTELSTVLPKSNDLSSVYVSFPSPYSPPGPNKVFRKSILKNRRSVSTISSEISDYQNIAADSLWKGYLHPSAGHSGKLVEMKRKKQSCTPTGVASRRSSRFSKHLARQPVLTSRDTPEMMINNMEVCSMKQMAEVIHTQSSKASEKTEKKYSSKDVFGCALLSDPGKEMHNEGNWKSELSRKPHWPEETKGGLNSASEKNSECHRVHFQLFQQWYHPENVEQKCNSDSSRLDNLRHPKSPALPTASVGESSEVPACNQEDQDKDHILTVTSEPSLGDQVCQGEDQDAPGSLAINESINIDGTVGKLEIKAHSGNLLNQILSLNEADAKIVDNPASHMQINDHILEEPWDQEVVYIPPMLLGVDEASDEGDSSSASSGMSTPVLRRLGNEESEEGFTISSASSCLSAKSLASTESRNIKEGGKNTYSSAEIRSVPNVMQETSSVQEGTFDQHRERQSSGEEKRTDKDFGPENMSAAQVVYFSHLPTLL